MLRRAKSASDAGEHFNRRYNVQPLLAAGGVSGIALGFGAQKITQNLLSGITMVRIPTGCLCALDSATGLGMCSCI